VAAGLDGGHRGRVAGVEEHEAGQLVVELLGERVPDRVQHGGEEDRRGDRGRRVRGEKRIRHLPAG
jgi:hypothetical protein